MAKPNKGMVRGRSRAATQKRDGQASLEPVLELCFRTQAWGLPS